MADFSPTGYWARYTEHDTRVIDIYPVLLIGVIPMIMDEDGSLLEIPELLRLLRDGGDTEGWTVSLAVTRTPPEAGE